MRTRNFFKIIAYCFRVFLVFLTLYNKVYAALDEETWHALSSDTKKICNSVKNLSAPQEDYSKEKLDSCDVDKYYFGIGVAVDYEQARYCALLANYENILVMIYANGQGVRRNIDLAIHYACRIEGQPSEINNRINALIKLKTDPHPKDDFDPCRYSISSRSALLCEEESGRIERAREEEYLKKITKIFMPEELKLLKKMQQAGLAYFTSRINNELYRGTTAAVLMQMLEEHELNREMFILLQKTEKCTLSNYTIRDYIEADNELNKLYAKIPKESDDGMGYTLAGVKKTERLWITYKNSWEHFGSLRCPKIDKSTWTTTITKQRIEHLKNIS